MPQVHIHHARWGVNRDSVADAVQQYTGLGLIDAQKVATEAVSGRPASIYVEDFHDVYELADLLSDLGLETEADESDEVRF